MKTSVKRMRERRWAVLGEDGRHVWLGRATDPSAEEVDASEDGLRRAGLAGWLVVTEGDYWSARSPMSLHEVRPLASPSIPFTQAVVAFEERRTA